MATKIELEHDADFARWNNVKTDLDAAARAPKISQGQIWWIGLGRNVGTEMNGKNDRYSRPVLIYKKLASDKFMAIPLTSQHHVGSWYVPFTQGGKFENAVVGEARVMSAKRLYRMIGEIDGADYGRVKEAFIKLYS